MNDEDVNSTLIALADSTRRAILNRLSRGEARITDLAKPFNISLNAVSKHIRVLERAQLVRRRRVWREYRVRIDPARLIDLADWINSHRTFWTERLVALDALLTAEDLQGKTEKSSKEK
jgi:DNA-binding transcriptional ArsR family regulator